MTRPIIAAQLYTLRDLLNGSSREEIYKVLKEVKDIGYTAIQISGVGEVTDQLAKIYEEVASELDLDICATHFGLDYMEDNLDHVIKVHKLWKCVYAGIGSMPEDLRHSEGIEPFIKRCNSLGQKLKEAGIQLVYHNHRFEFEKLEGKPWLQWLLDGFDPDCVQLELDTYWVQAGGGDPVEWVKKVSGNMGIMHLKDMRIVKDVQEFAEIGQGNLDWKKILEAAEQSGVKYAAVEQDAFTEDPLKSLEISYKYLASLMASL